MSLIGRLDILQCRASLAANGVQPKVAARLSIAEVDALDAGDDRIDP
jgi:hypothetical protein